MVVSGLGKMVHFPAYSYLMIGFATAAANDDHMQACNDVLLALLSEAVFSQTCDSCSAI